MTAEMSWPHRFRVTIHTNAGSAIEYFVVSWLSRDKAVSLATSTHESRYKEEPGAQIHAVTVEDLGPVGRDPQGAMALEGHDIVDRMEW